MANINLAEKCFTNSYIHLLGCALALNLYEGFATYS